MGKPKATPKAEKISCAELSRRLGISPRAVASAIARQEIPPELVGRDPSSGRVCILDASRAVAAYMAAHTPTPGESAPRGPVVPEGVDFADPSTWPKDAAGLKAVREHWGSIQAKQKAELTAGELVRADDVRRAVFDAMRVTRDQLLRIPDRTAEDMAAELGTDRVDVVRRVLTDGIERGLRDLAAALEANATPRAADVEEVEPT